MKSKGKPPKKLRRGVYFLLSIVPFLLLTACASLPEPPPRPTAPTKAPAPPERPKPSAALLQPLAQVKPVIAEEEKMPFESKIFSLSARSAPLQDVIMGIAKEASLNLVLEKGVDPLEPVSIEIANLPLRKALDLLFSSYDYFYEIEGNVLRVKAVETRFFKFEFPTFANAATSNVGGDVLGGASGGGGASMKGEFTIETQAEDEALDVWKQIRDALQPRQEGVATGPQAGALLSPSGRAQINSMTGVIVVTDRKENLEIVAEFLKRLEKSLRRQVVIEARILEVTLNDEHQFGIDWTYVSGDVTWTQTVRTGVGAMNLGFIPTAGDGSSWFLDALSTQGEINVLSAPRLNVLNGQSAVLQVGRTLPYLEWTVQATTTAAGTTVYTAVPQVSRAQSGISLGVTPQISEDGVVTLHLVPIITDLVAYQTFTFDGNNFDVPIIDVRGTDSIVQAPDGSTVVLAGLIQERNSDNITGIPGLKDIPLFGALFSQQRRTRTKVELVISLTPTIVER